MRGKALHCNILFLHVILEHCQSNDLASMHFFSFYQLYNFLPELLEYCQSNCMSEQNVEVEVENRDSG